MSFLSGLFCGTMLMVIAGITFASPIIIGQTADLEAYCRANPPALVPGPRR